MHSPLLIATHQKTSTRGKKMYILKQFFQKRGSKTNRGTFVERDLYRNPRIVVSLFQQLQYHIQYHIQ